MEKFKSIKISEKLHQELKDYARINSLKMGDWIEKIINKEFKKITEGNNDCR